MKLSKKIIISAAVIGLVNLNFSVDAKPVKKVTKPQRNNVITAKVTKNYQDIDRYIDYANFAEANKLINTMLSKNSKDITANALYVVAQAKQGNLDVAQTKLNSLMPKYQNNANLHYAQAVINIKRQASSDMEYKNKSEELINDAVKELNTAIKLSPNHYAAYNALGVISLNTGKSDRANYYFNKALMVYPNYATAIDNTGTINYLKGDYDAAQSKFLKAISLNPHSSTAYFHLAQVYDKKSLYSQALDALDHSLKLNPNCSVAFNLKGEIYKKQGNEAAAISAFKKSIAVKPENTSPYINLANIYEKRFDNEYAIANLKTALSVNSSLNNVKLKIADISLHKGDNKQALKYYSSLVGVEDYNAEALKGVANAYFADAKNAVSQSGLSTNKELEKAYENVERALFANPSDLQLYLAKLKLARLMNKEKVSQETLDKIVSAPVKGINDLLAKGDAYFAMNKYNEAKEMFEKSVLFAQTPEDCLFVAEILTYDKFYPSAKKILRKVLVYDPSNEEALHNLDYIMAMEKQSDSLYKDAKFFNKKDKNKVFAREYALKSLEFNPTNYNAALLSAKLCEKQKHYPEAIDSYKVVEGLSLQPRKAKKINKKIKKLEKKLAKINNTYMKREDKEFQKCQNKLTPDL